MMDKAIPCKLMTEKISRSVAPMLDILRILNQPGQQRGELRSVAVPAHVADLAFLNPYFVAASSQELAQRAAAEMARLLD